MFCPKCAAELVRRDGELTCIAGEMGLSQHIERVLTERYSGHTPSPRRGEATTEEILVRQRQLASGYNYYMSFSVSYSFGSIFNNIVNPRFGGGGGFCC